MIAARLAVAGALLAAAASAGCSRHGELVVAVQTDMSLPKDIDAITIEVWSPGATPKSLPYEALGHPDTEVKLPATLGLVAEEDPGGAVRIKVSARIGGAVGAVRILREVVAEVPEGRIALLPIPLHFLCDGSGVDDGSGNAINTLCVEGTTCVAGSCAPRDIDSAALPDYAPEDVYGGGSGFGDGACFDVAPCFASAAAVTGIDDDPCTFPGGGAINVALQVDSDGMCDGTDCFIALDAGSDAGWIEDGGQIRLPPAACEQITAGKIMGVVTAPVTGACPQKTSRLPTCGPWSASGGP